MKIFAILLMLALPLAARAAAEPSEADIVKYREKLARYLAAGYSPDDTVQGLQSWYGWPFLVRYDYNAGTVDYLVKAPALGTEIRYMRTIGSAPLDGPRLLLEQKE